MVDWTLTFGALSLAFSLSAVPAWSKYPTWPANCPEFHFPNSAFESIERDHRRALLYVTTGNKADNHGVAFLIETSPPYYLTARHVVELSISNPSQPITGIDARKNKFALQVIAEDPDLDIALLKGDGALPLSDAWPYELFFDGLEPQDVTFSGLAFADETDLTSAPPKENRFQYNENATQLHLRVNTDKGDSGAPVYNKQGLVLGVVTKKRVVSQVTAVAMSSLSGFMVRPAMGVPTGGFAWQLHDFLAKTSDRAALVDRLTPRHSPDQVSNFQLLGAMELVLQSQELSKVNEGFLYCPISYAAHDRGLRSEALKWEWEVGRYIAGLPDAPSTTMFPLPDSSDRRPPGDHGSLQAKPPLTETGPAGRKTGLQYLEEVGDILFARAAEWDRKGDADFYGQLSSKAEASYREAIVAYLQADKRPLFVFEGNESNAAQDQAHLVLSHLGIDSLVDLTSVGPTGFNGAQTDDKFAALLNKYYQAAAGAAGWHVLGSGSYVPADIRPSDEPKKMAARNTAAAWATLISGAGTQRAKSWSVLGDAMLKAGLPGEAARSLASAHRVAPTDIDVVKTYETVKLNWARSICSSCYIAGIDAGAAINQESPLTRVDVQNFAVRAPPPQTVVAANSSLQDANRFSEAEAFYRRALAIDEQSYGQDDPKVATDLRKLASVLQATNRVGEAEPLLRRALAIGEKSYGQDDPTVAADLSTLASVLQAANRGGEAVPLLRRALAVNEKSWGADHPDIATDLRKLASILQATNNVGEAELLFRRALAIDEQYFGSEHPKIATDLNELASVLQTVNRFGEAVPLLRRALAIYVQNFGPDRPKVATDFNNLASVLQATNQVGEAEQLYRRALVIDVQNFGPDHSKVATDLSNLASVLQAVDRFGEAEPLLRRALAIGEKNYGTDRPEIATDLNNLASVLQATNQVGEAEQLYRRAQAIAERNVEGRSTIMQKQSDVVLESQVRSF